jgi:hypothetical protein
LIVVPGIPDNQGIMTSAPLLYEHGWPFIYLDRYSPPPPLRANPTDAEIKFLKNWREKLGLRWATLDGEYSLLLAEDAFAREGASWLDGDRWPIKGISLVSASGLSLDLATAFVILVAAASAYECWARRRWQYRLWHLLGFGFLMALGLGWWRNSMNVCERESQAIAALRNKGLDVSWRCGGPVWLVKLVGPKHMRPFHDVVSVNRHIIADAQDMFVGEADVSSVVNSDLDYVRKLPHLRQLSLDHTRITDEGLKNLKGLRELDYLGLEGTSITDAGLANLRDLPKLSVLALDDTEITGAGLLHLRALPCLRVVWINHTQITDVALATIKELPELRSLSLDDTQLTDAGLKNLEGAVQLEELAVNRTNVTDEGVARLQLALPNCKIDWKDKWQRQPTTKRTD